MGPAQESFDVRHSIITGVGIRDQVSIKTLKQFPGILTAPAAGIKEKCCLDLFASCTAHDPHKGFAAWKFPFFLIALDPDLIHMEQPVFQQFLMKSSSRPVPAIPDCILSPSSPCCFWKVPVPAGTSLL